MTRREWAIAIPAGISLAVGAYLALLGFLLVLGGPQ